MLGCTGVFEVWTSDNALRGFFVFDQRSRIDEYRAPSLFSLLPLLRSLRRHLL